MDVKKKPIARKRTPAEQQQVVEPVVVETVVEAVDNETLKIDQRLKEMIQELKDFKTMTRGLCNNFIETLEDAQREIKSLQKHQKQPRVRKNPKKPCTFEIPVPISKELCQLLQVPTGTIMSRNDVTHELHKYCDKHGLMNPENRRIINPNPQLKSLLKNYPEKPIIPLSWLNIQTYLKHHYTSS